MFSIFDFLILFLFIEKINTYFRNIILFKIIIKIVLTLINNNIIKLYLYKYLFILIISNCFFNNL